VADLRSLYLANAHSPEGHLSLDQKFDCRFDQHEQKVWATCVFTFGPQNWELSGFWAEIAPSHPDFFTLLAFLLLKGSIFSNFQVLESRLSFALNTADWSVLKTNPSLIALTAFLQTHGCQNASDIQLLRTNEAFTRVILECVKPPIREKLGHKLGSLFG
jgi:hypothetical protein